MAKKFAIFGNPVEHSKSPLMHNAAFKELGFDGEYFKVLLEDGSKLKEKFFEFNLSGANITVPHKEAAFRAADVLDSFAKRVGAVNTLVLKDNKLYGYNTDAPGFVQSIKKYNIKSVLILGAGGTAQAVAPALRDANYSVEILNRSSARLASFQAENFSCYSFDNFDINKRYDMIVNMTSAGLKDSNLPAPKEILDALFLDAKVAVDIIYGKETPFLSLAKSNNLTTADGAQMLVGQGVLAFDYFTQHRYNLQEVEDIMSRALKSK
jgi:shikimate dehydrogenase